MILGAAFSFVLIPTTLSALPSEGSTDDKYRPSGYCKEYLTLGVLSNKVESPVHLPRAGGFHYSMQAPTSVIRKDMLCSCRKENGENLVIFNSSNAW